MSYKTTYPPYPDKFKPGDIAVLTDSEAVRFSDGAIHLPGEAQKVTEDNVAYYNVWHHIYEKAEEKS